MNDTRDVVEWLYRNIGEYGGDPTRIFVGGHSAGAILSAHVAVDPSWLGERGPPEKLIRGFFPISGPYDLREFGSFVDTYLPDGAPHDEASPALVIQDDPPQSVVAYGTLEEPFIEQSRAFGLALEQKGGRANVVVLEGNHDHTALALIVNAS